MIEYLITLRRGACTEWGLLEDPTPSNETNQDLMKCKYLGTTMRVVLRFTAPSWEQAREVFNWKSLYDPKLPKKQYDWAEISSVMEDHKRAQLEDYGRGCN